VVTGGIEPVDAMPKGFVKGTPATPGRDGFDGMPGGVPGGTPGADGVVAPVRPPSAVTETLDGKPLVRGAVAVGVVVTSGVEGPDGVNGLVTGAAGVVAGAAGGVAGAADVKGEAGVEVKLGGVVGFGAPSARATIQSFTNFCSSGVSGAR